MAKNIVLLDFDGVLVNSAPECFKTCYDTIISFENLLTHNEAKSFKKIKKKRIRKVLSLLSRDCRPTRTFLFINDACKALS